jgi:hypothetical protein
MRSPWFVALSLVMSATAGCSARGVAALQEPTSSVEAATATAATRLDTFYAGAAWLLVVRHPQGAFDHASTYVARYASSPAKLSLVEIDRPKSVETLAAGGVRGASLEIEGVDYPLRVTAGGACIAPAAGACDVELVSPLVPDEIRAPDYLARARDALIADLDAYVDRFPQKVAEATCTVAGPYFGHPLVYWAYRSIAERLAFGADLARVEADPDAHATLWNSLHRAANFLMASFVDTTRTDYETCNGDRDGMTAMQTVRGLAALDALDPDTNLHAYVRRLVMANASYLTSKTDEYLSTLSVTNFLGMVVTTWAEVERMEPNAAAPLARVIPAALKRILADQALSPAQEKCGAEHQFSLSYGGWGHSEKPDDCVQRLAYHDLIHAALLSFHDLAKSTGRCASPEWSTLCEEVPWNMLASLIWVRSLERPNGSVWTPSLHSATGKAATQAEATGLGVYTFFSTLSREPQLEALQATKATYTGHTIPMSQLVADAHRAMVHYASSGESKHVGSAAFLLYLARRVH